MEPLTFRDICQLFTESKNVATISGNKRAIERASRYCEAVETMRAWPTTVLTFTSTVNELRRIVDSLVVYMLYASRIHKAPDHVLDALIRCGNRNQELLAQIVAQTLRDNDFDDTPKTRAEIVADLTTILTNYNGVLLG